MNKINILYKLLLNQPKLLDSENMLVWSYWTAELNGNEPTRENVYNLTSPETIAREVRNLKQDSKRWIKIELKLAKINNKLLFK